MQEQEPIRATLNEILITEELSGRARRIPNWQAQAIAMQLVARQMASHPQTLLQKLVDIALDLCNAGSAGISLLETTPTGEEVFRAHVLAGALAQYIGGTTPRDFSPCGVTLERGTPQLFSHPERYFTYFQAANTLIVEELVLPLIAEHHVLGTIWIMSHDEERHFDSEDVRIMMSLADFTTTTLVLQQRQTGELLAANAALKAEIAERRQAQEQARALISNLPGGAAFVVDHELRYLLAEGEALASAGFRPEDLVGCTIFEVLPPELVANYEMNYRKALAGKPFEHEHNSHEHTYISRGTPLRAENGEVYGVLAVSYDITERVRVEDERKKAEAALRCSEAKYRSLFENVNDGFCIIEMLYDEIGQPFNYRFLEVNPAFETQSGFKHVIGKTARDCTLDLSAELLTNYQSVLTTGKPVQFEIHPTGVEQHFQIAAYRHGAQENKQLAILLSDITERKQAEEKLRRAAEMDAFRVKLSDALRALADPVQIQAQTCRLLGEYLGVDRAYYVEVNEAEGYAHVNQDYVRGDSPSLVGTFGLAEYGWIVPYLQRGETIIVVDTQTANIVPDIDREAMAAIRILAHISTPLIKAGELVGALCVTESTPREWSTAEVELVRETAERIWATIERARVEAALRELEIQRIREQSAHEQERQRAETLAELDRAKTIFFSNVSHEFRTPLTLLVAPLQEALSDSVNPLPQEQRSRLELAQRNAMRLLKLVNTLLDFSRIEAGRMEAVYEPTDLAMYTTELASVFRSAIERAGLRLVVECPAIPEPVYVDQEMWEKIVLNLLSNAFKFTKEGEIKLRLHLCDDHHVRLLVEDTGTGIEPEELPHLFERFYQVNRAAARTHEGSGIGLALVQELIKMHGGTVEVSSTVGQGSCFTVTIPLGTAHLPSDRLRLDVSEYTTATRSLISTALGTQPYIQQAQRWIGEKSTPSTGSTVAQEENTPSPMSYVLIVDDNADMRDYLTRILSEHVKVHAVADGAAALAAVNEQLPDLVLTDVMMPSLNGFDLLQALRASARTKEVPIVLLSARAGEESVIEGLVAGADDYLIKPFSANELVTRVNAYLQLAQERCEALREERTINRRKDEVLSTVSHELNTPLVAILGWTRLLRSSPPSPAMLTKALLTIERNATVQAKLVQDLLDISRISAGKIHLNLEPVQLQGVIEQALATVGQSLETKDIRLDCLLSPLPTIVQGDPERLQQIVLNLLTNAAKFTPQHGRIRISLLAQENQAQIVITDTGCGIDAEFLPYIFDTFSQAPNTKKGLGLGLAITLRLVELHGGTIIAQSPGIGQGATFIVKLPLVGASL
jgi:PAS domain S-box-containing protein